MLWTLAFDRIGVVMSDLYFVDPTIDQGGAGAERGVRLELRIFERDPLKGSVYSAVPIRVDRPIWRVDLLETTESEPGSLNRAHHHPRFHAWDPGPRVFVEELSASPLSWTAERFAHIEDVLDEAGMDGAGLDASAISARDVESLRAAGPEVVRQLETMLGEVAAGRAGLPPDEEGSFVRRGWL